MIAGVQDNVSTLDKPAEEEVPIVRASHSDTRLPPFRTGY